MFLKKTLPPLLAILTLVLTPLQARTGSAGPRKTNDARRTEKPWSAEDFPVAYLQDARQVVSDPDGVLRPATRDSISALFLRLKEERGVETLVAVARRIEGGDAYTFGMELGRRLGVGSKEQNSGLILVLATDDRAYYILTGRGLEGTLTDALCRRIANHHMLPSMKRGDWDAALLLGSRAIAAEITGDRTLAPDRRNGNDEGSGSAPILALVIVAVAAIGGWIIFLRMDKKSGGGKCPGCGSHALRYTGQSITLDPRDPGRRKYIFRCARCGYSEPRDSDGTQRAGLGTLMFLLLLLGSHRGGRGGGAGGRF